jgi:hypothetical protein
LVSRGGQKKLSEDYFGGRSQTLTLLRFVEELGLAAGIVDPGLDYALTRVDFKPRWVSPILSSCRAYLIFTTKARVNSVAKAFVKNAKVAW